MTTDQDPTMKSVETNTPNAQTVPKPKPFDPVLGFILTFLMQGAGLVLVTDRIRSSLIWQTLAFLLPVPCLLLYATTGRLSWLVASLVVFLVICLGLAVYAFLKAKHPIVRKGNSGKFVGLIVYANVLGIGLLVCFRMMVFDFYHVPQGSMAPTVLPGDIFLANKMTRNVKRGDVIVFQYPVDKSKSYVKRVVGLPGDTIVIKRDILFVNGKRVTAQSGTPYRLNSQKIGKLHTEKTIDGATYSIAILGKAYGVIEWRSDRDARTHLKPWGPTVPQGHVFVLGDNRRNSHDSRYWGLVPKANIISKALNILISVSGDRIRWERTWKPVFPKRRHSMIKNR
jgi:signal peptidase I